MTDYNKYYDEFLKLVDDGAADSSKASLYLVKMSRIFSDYNTATNAAKKKSILKHASISGTIDEATNKPITGTKASALADASDEYMAYLDMKTHLENISVYISAIKYFQGALTKEYGNAYNT